MHVDRLSLSFLLSSTPNCMTSLFCAGLKESGKAHPLQLTSWPRYRHHMEIGGAV